MGSYALLSSTEADDWRERVLLARKNMSFVGECRQIVKEQQQWPLPAPDGSTAVKNALLQESLAREEYMRVLRIFTDLTIHGKLPGNVPNNS